ncbi:MAG: hypothetical protein ACLFMT_03715 [Halobacteriales archaeon]
MSVEHSYPHAATRHNEIITVLREDGPQAGPALPRQVQHTDRRYVGVLDVSRSGSGDSKSRGRTYTVYYLYGDERRAVRRYIEENTEFVRSCMRDRVNPLNLNQEEFWWRMFREEWVWGGHDTADNDGL